MRCRVMEPSVPLFQGDDAAPRRRAADRHAGRRRHVPAAGRVPAARRPHLQPDREDRRARGQN